MGAIDPNVLLPLLSSLLSAVFALLLVDQWRTRRRPYQAVWAIGMLWYALSAGTEFVGGAFGWNEALYRAWYLIGAVWVAGWLGLGTAFLLARTRFGYAFAGSLLLAGLFTWLSQAKYHYAGSGLAPVVYAGAAVAAAIVIVVLSSRRDPRWAGVAAAVVLGGSLFGAVLAISTPLAAPGYAVDPATHIPTGELFPGTLRLLTPFFNVTGAFALVMGALYSAYMFMPKRRLMRYDLRRDRGWAPFLANLVLAPVALTLNFLASLPGAARALATRRVHSRVPATMLIAAGGLVPAITSGANRFGATSAFFVGELAGVVLLFAGFLVSVEVFRDVRVPFTALRLRTRDEAPVPFVAAQAPDRAAATVRVPTGGRES